MPDESQSLFQVVGAKISFFVTVLVLLKMKELQFDAKQDFSSSNAGCNVTSWFLMASDGYELPKNQSLILTMDCILMALFRGFKAIYIEQIIDS